MKNARENFFCICVLMFTYFLPVSIFKSVFLSIKFQSIVKHSNSSFKFFFVRFKLCLRYKNVEVTVDGLKFDCLGKFSNF